MKYLIAAAALAALSGNAFAEASCTAMATEKKLAGAAMTSFMTKCEKDAATACDLDSKAKKLAGAALDAHMKKCINDAVGAKASSCADMATEKKLAGAAADSNAIGPNCKRLPGVAGDGGAQAAAGPALHHHPLGGNGLRTRRLHRSRRVDGQCRQPRRPRLRRVPAADCRRRNRTTTWRF